MHPISIMLEPIKVEIINDKVLLSFFSTVAGVIIGGKLTYLFTLRAQRKEFLNQIMNDARMRINDSLWCYQEWLGEVKAFIITNKYKTLHGIFDSNCSKEYESSCKLFFETNKSFTWGVVMEEYEILFPETKKVRMELLIRNKKIRGILDDFTSKIIDENRGDFTNYINDIDEKMDFIEDQIYLIEDLKIYLQNKTLSKITKNKATERVPQDSSMPRIIVKNGELVIDNYNDN